eukprot:29746_1
MSLIEQSNDNHNNNNNNNGAVDECDDEKGIQLIKQTHGKDIVIPQTENIIYILKPNVSAQLPNQSPISLNLSKIIKSIGPSNNVINFGNNPSTNQLILERNGMLTFQKKQNGDSFWFTIQWGQLICRDSKWYIIDKYSSGIKINGKRIVAMKEYLLHIGDEIVFYSEFKYIFTTTDNSNNNNTEQPQTTTNNTTDTNNNNG